MRKVAMRTLMALLLVALGWAAGRAQAPQPDFELIVDAPTGQTNVQCKRGCELAWVERGHQTASGQSTFTFACTGTERCSSYRIGGWIKQ